MAATLLVADDSVTIQRVIELTFADEDIRVVSVGDGDQAIARIASYFLALSPKKNRRLSFFESISKFANED